MLGAITGDIVGSIYEFDNNRQTSFPLFTPESDFTDDTVLTVATAECLLSGGDYTVFYKEYGHRFPGRGYGGRFQEWLESNSTLPYNSYGNGSAMRVSPAGFAFRTLEETLYEAQRSAVATHNHPEGVKGAQAVAAAIFLSRRGRAREYIREFITNAFGYDLSRSSDEIRPGYAFNETCRGSVPEAIIAFLESTDFESALRLAVSLGGDSDTIACITGSIAEAYYGGVPEPIAAEVWRRLPDELAEVVDRFHRRFAI
ncbi:ADP-ribosylation/Crystallin J1 [Dehalogenimonas lykanthroporepellens BL-DC-9]|jgi:ADP-ribosylglycohydrolase|nr:ADP-ribosylation/Crystallin J1 [Dehalogenimonas lykanthroporepellens BL-DC-9]